MLWQEHKKDCHPFSIRMDNKAGENNMLYTKNQVSQRQLRLRDLSFCMMVNTLKNEIRFSKENEIDQ